MGISIIIGEFALGQRNEGGDRFIEIFKLPQRRLYTWKSPADTKDNVIRDQIDYIANNEHY